ncbi:MAG: hypothetical protein K8I65_09795 [Thermoanaerobaculia bacterium]|nr:hypothetical protein [Thermoanaerobaculia bacterium]
MAELARLLRAALRLAVPLGLMAAVSTLAHLPVGAPPEEAALRLALRTGAARVEICRDRTAAELAALPAHMRQVRVCDETAIDYRLRVAIDGAVRLDRRVTHRGVRRTRPLVVDVDLPVAPGVRRLEVEFLPVDPPVDAAESLPAATFAESVDFAPGRILLLALEADGGLRLRAGAVSEAVPAGEG